MEHQLIEQKHPIEISDDLTNIRVIIKEMVSALSKSQKKSRERSLVITKLEEAEMWAVNAQSKE